MPALDGVRALAIAAVLFYHGGIPLLPGGFLGVDVFFVLSGFLITSLLLNEYARTGAISLSGFYWNRARRLLPAFVTMLFVVATFASLFMQDSVASTWRDLPWALDGLSNWWLVLHQQSYFESIGRPLLFQHTWSLAVEAQFYALWPCVLLLVLPVFGKRAVGLIALVLGVASAAASLFLGAHLSLASSESVSHLYFGTDTRSMGLFLGAALAALWRPAAALAPGGLRLTLSLAGLLPPVALIALFFLIDEKAGGAQWVVGFPICAILTALLVVAATVPGSLIGTLLSVRPMRWIGERSYGMYLWHWPIFQATRPGIDFPFVGPYNLVFRLLLTAIVAELSYRFVEMPVRRGALERLWTRIRGMRPRALRWAAAGTAGALMAIGATEAVLANRAIESYKATLQAYVIPLAPPPLKTGVGTAPGSPRHASGRSRTSRDHGMVAMLSERRQAILTAPALLVGDSVMLGASQWIAHSLRVVKTDAVVGRQAMTTLDVIESMASAGRLEPTMVIDLGNNGTVEEPTLRTMLRLLKKCDQVVIVNARVPRPWQDGNDVLMARVVPQYSNAVLADWYNASAGHPEYFGPDGVHMDAAGAQAYTHVIVTALEAKAMRALVHAKRAQKSAPKKPRPFLPRDPFNPDGLESITPARSADSLEKQFALVASWQNRR
jgi:peptidoglycan/LPS O-acetylase OafA/YrhL